MVVMEQQELWWTHLTVQVVAVQEECILNATNSSSSNNHSS
jgi:hypothetical protein